MKKEIIYQNRIHQNEENGENKENTENAGPVYKFILEVSGHDPEKGTAARIIRMDTAGNELILMSYTWPHQLIPEISLKSSGEMTENGELHFTLALTVHHVTGMVQGEFTEEQDYTILNPMTDEIVCSVEDIRRKTRFAIAERHLEHVPHRTYPPLDGAQGPYGHPAVRSLPPIPKRKPEDRKA